MNDVFRYSDEFGPTKVIHVYEPSVELKAVLVVDNVAAGPSIGGVRMASDVSMEECCRLARAMTFKNAAAGLPHGGGKIVLYGNPKMPKAKKAQRIRALAVALRNETDYIFAPDMGTNEECMAWVKDEIGRVVGLPRELGGIPLDEIGATGWGIRHATEVALNYADFDMDGARIVIQGFGAVGKHSARFLTEVGAKLVATCDSRGAIYNPNGLNVEALVELKNVGKSVSGYTDGQSLDRDALIDIECDIWIPAARPDVIHEDNAHRLNTKVVVEAANIPITHGAEGLLHSKGILCIPDIIANAGGVICAATEYRGGTRSGAFESIREKLGQNTRQVLETVHQEGILPREAAMELAKHRVKKAMELRRWSLFSSAPHWA